MSEFTVKSYIDPDELEDDLSFSENTLDDAMMKQAALSAHYGVCAAKAAQQASLLKMRLKVVEAKRYKALREDYTSRGEKVTEAMLNMLVTSDPEVIRAEKDYIAANYQSDVGKSTFEAFKQRRDMIVQISKNLHEEMKGEMRLQIEEAVAKMKGNALRDIVQ